MRDNRLKVPSNSPTQTVHSSSSFPILALPPEILSHVFTFTVENNYFGHWLESTPPRFGAFHLAKVCSRWRNVAVNTPEIWARIWIGHDFSLGSSPVTAEQQDRLRRCLGRAKSFPLSVEIILRDTLSVGALNMKRFTLLRVLMESLGWATLTLHFRGLLQDVCRAMLGELRKSLESLRRLEIYIEGRGDMGVLQLWQGETEFPNLHTLHLHHDTLQVEMPSFGINGMIDATIFPYSRLNHLTLNLNRTHEETLQVLQSCQKHIQSLQINLFSIGHDMTSSSTPPLTFVSLQTLIVHSPHSPSRIHNPNILDALRTPSLESLTLSNFTRDQKARISLTQTLASLLERSGVLSSLRELRFSAYAIDTSHPGALIDILDITTGLEKVHFRVSGGTENVDDNYGLFGALRGLTGTSLLPNLKHLHILYENISPTRHALWSKEFETMVEWRSANGLQSVLLEIIVRPSNKSSVGLNLEQLRRLQKEQGLAIRVVKVWNGRVHGEILGYTPGA
ncbi:hypothetical protein L218DRAFT_987447 [Marasmius fiardii PR-910]|nr:hypothetical protein L218DRAFT_987447 [Marasmius fiardii PR-910]